jgi:hypothetical protein
MNILSTTVYTPPTFVSHSIVFFNFPLDITIMHRAQYIIIVCLYVYNAKTNLPIMLGEFMLVCIRKLNMQSKYVETVIIPH